MTTMMRRVFVWAACAMAVLASADTAIAQYGTRRASTRAVGENYHVEAALDFWRPGPSIEIASESLGIAGTVINAEEDLGVESSMFTDLKFVLRPTEKFKFRIGYTPIKYDAESVLTRRIVFNGQAYRVGLPVNSQLEWNAWRFGIEYDALYTSRGFAGFIVEAKYTDIEVALQTPVGQPPDQFTHVRAPIPTIGGIGRVYVTDNVAITGELTGLRLTIDEDEGRYFDFDLNGVYNVNDNFGVRFGFRRLSVEYLVDTDQGDLKLSGVYFGAAARF
jgi:hypothetical protein